MESSLKDCRFDYATSDENYWHQLCKRDYVECYENLKRDTFYETYVLCSDLEKLKRELMIVMKHDELYYSEILESLHKRITAVPSEMGQLVNLQEISLHNNQIAIIPIEMCQLINCNGLICVIT